MLTTGHSWGDDFAQYILQAKSLVENRRDEFIRENRFTVDQSSRLVAARRLGPTIGPVAYPWGTPVLLSPLYAGFGLNLLALKAANVFFYMLFLLTLVAFLRTRYGGFQLLLCVSLFAFNPWMLAVQNEILSDIPSLFFSTVAVFMLDDIGDPAGPGTSSPLRRAGFGLLMAIAIFVRVGNGAALVLTSVVADLVSRRMLPHEDGPSRRAGEGPGGGTRNDARLGPVSRAWALPYMVCAVSTLVLYVAFPKGGEGYLMQLRSWSAKAMIENVGYYVASLRRFFSGTPFPLAAYVGTVPLLVAGLITSGRRDWRLVLYGLTTIGLYAVFPGRQARYLYPVLPIYVHFVLQGFSWRPRERFGILVRPLQWIGGFVLAVAVLLFVRATALQAAANLRSDRESTSGVFVPASRDMFAFVRGNIPESAVVVFFKPRAMRLFTARRSFMATEVSDMIRGTYVCLYLGPHPSNQIPTSAVEELTSAGRLRLVYTNPDFRLYKIEASPG